MTSQVQKHQEAILPTTEALSSLPFSLSFSPPFTPFPPLPHTHTPDALTCHDGVGLWPRHAAPNIGRGGAGQVGLHVVQPSSQGGHG